MQYKTSLRTEARILSGVFLDKNKHDRDKLASGITALLGQTNAPNFMEQFNNFINENKISSLFAHENKFTGFFLQLDKAYDTERKIAILQKLESCLQKHKEFLAGQYNNLAQQANKIINRIKSNDRLQTSLESFPEKLENRESIVININQINLLAKARTDAIAPTKPIKIFAEQQSNKKTTIRSLDLTKGRKEWRQLDAITNQITSLITRYDEVLSVKQQIHIERHKS